MQQVWIMIKSHLQQLNFLKGFKIKCIMLYHIKQLLKLYIIEQIQKKKIWALLLGKILETDVVIAKNYLSKEELESLELIVSAFLDLAENSSIPKDVGRLFLLAIFFSEYLVIKSNMTALRVSLDICL